MSKSTDKQIPVMMSVCFWCGNEKNEILVGRRPVNTDKIKRNAVANYDPCDTCSNTMKEGIAFIEMSDKPYEDKQPLMFNRGYPSGRWAVIADEGVKQIISDEDILRDVLEKRKTFVHPEAFKMLFHNSS